jgi:hypothetical protein
MTNKTPQTEMESAVRNDWAYGFTPGAENWNGRLAMIGFVAALLIEVFSKQGVLHFWGILSSGVTPVV